MVAQRGQRAEPLELERTQRPAGGPLPGFIRRGCPHGWRCWAVRRWRMTGFPGCGQAWTMHNRPRAQTFRVPLTRRVGSTMRPPFILGKIHRFDAPVGVAGHGGDQGLGRQGVESPRMAYVRRSPRSGAWLSISSNAAGLEQRLGIDGQGPDRPRAKCGRAVGAGQSGQWSGLDPRGKARTERRTKSCSSAIHLHTREAPPAHTKVSICRRKASSTRCPLSSRI